MQQLSCDTEEVQFAQYKNFCEMDSKYTYEMLMAELKKSIAEQSLQQKAGGEGDLTDTTTTHDDDAAYLSDLVGTCEQKGIDFLARQELRAEELEAVNEAIEIISGAVSGASDEHLPGLIQSGTAFAQLRAQATTHCAAEIAAILAEPCFSHQQPCVGRLGNPRCQ